MRRDVSGHGQVEGQEKFAHARALGESSTSSTLLPFFVSGFPYSNQIVGERVPLSLIKGLVRNLVQKDPIKILQRFSLESVAFWPGGFWF